MKTKRFSVPVNHISACCWAHDDLDKYIFVCTDSGKGRNQNSRLSVHSSQKYLSLYSDWVCTAVHGFESRWSLNFFFRLLFRNCLNCVSTAKIFHNVIISITVVHPGKMTVTLRSCPSRSHWRYGMWCRVDLGRVQTENELRYRTFHFNTVESSIYKRQRNEHTKL